MDERRKRCSSTLLSSAFPFPFMDRRRDEEVMPLAVVADRQACATGNLHGLPPSTYSMLGIPDSAVLRYFTQQRSFSGTQDALVRDAGNGCSPF